MKLYKLRDSRTGLFSSGTTGGERWTKDGKIWRNASAINKNLRHRRQLSAASFQVVELEGVETASYTIAEWEKGRGKRRPQFEATLLELLTDPKLPDCDRCSQMKALLAAGEAAIIFFWTC